MTRRHDRGVYGPVRLVVIFTRSAFAATRQPMPTPRHARQPFTAETPRSAR